MNKRNDASEEFNPSLAEVNQAREQKKLIDPEKGPQKKKRKKID